MAMAACQAQCLQAVNYLAQGSSSSLEGRSRPATVSFTRTAARDVQGLRQRGNARLVISAAEGSSSCCGGSEGSDGGKQSCSSHGSNASPPPGLANVGAEFESMVSRSTMQEFEREYDTGEMEGTITRDVVADVMSEMPELANGSTEEKFVDVDAVLSEAMSLAKEDDFVFDVEMEGTMV